MKIKHKVLTVIVSFMIVSLPFITNAQSANSNAFCYTFTKYLIVGSQNDDVTNLLRVLVKEGLFDRDTAFQDGRQVLSFGDDVASSVIDFQIKYGIKKTGTVGPITRAKLNKLYGCTSKSKASTIVKPTSTPTYSTIPSSTHSSKPSNVPSAIFSKSSITVLTPTNVGGSSYFIPGDVVKFQWSSVNVIGVNKISLIPISGGNTISILNLSKNVTPLNANSYNWTVPSNITTGKYKVGISIGDIYSESSGTLSISTSIVSTPSATPVSSVQKNSITVLTPVNPKDSSSSFKVGDQFPILWSSTGIRGVRMIKLVSTTNTSNQVTILDLSSIYKLPITTDSYTWTIPSTVPAGRYNVMVQMGLNESIISATSAGEVTVTNDGMVSDDTMLNWNTYTDPLAFTYKYPATWHSSWPEGCAKVFGPKSNDYYITVCGPDYYSENTKNIVMTNEKLISSENISIGGYSAIRREILKLQTYQNRYQYNVEIVIKDIKHNYTESYKITQKTGDWTIYFNILKESEKANALVMLDKILSTFKFTNNPTATPISPK